MGFPVPKISTTLSLTFPDSSGLTALTPTWKVVLLGDDDNLQVAAQATEWASGPSINSSQHSCSYFYARFILITYEPAKTGPSFFHISSKYASLFCRSFFHVSSKYASLCFWRVPRFNCFLDFSLLFNIVTPFPFVPLIAFVWHLFRSLKIIIIIGHIVAFDDILLIFGSVRRNVFFSLWSLMKNSGILFIYLFVFFVLGFFFEKKKTFWDGFFF